MASEEEQVAQLERRPLVRLSRSGDPSAVKPAAMGKAPEGPGVEPLPGPSAEEGWGGRGRVPGWLIPVVAVTRPVVGIWLCGAVAVRKYRESHESAVVQAVPATVGDRTPMEVAMAFLEAESVEGRLALTFRTEVTQDRVLKPLQGPLAAPVEVASIAPLGTVRAMGQLRYFRFGIVSPSAGRRLVCVVDSPEGLLVDWDAFARHGTVPAGGPHQERFTEAMARVFVKELRYYNFSFTDEEKWRSFELENPDWEEPVYGYARRNSTTAKILDRLAARAGPDGQRMTLTLRGFGADRNRRQYEIKEVLAAGWVLGEGKFEADWQRREQLRKQAARGEFVTP